MQNLSLKFQIFKLNTNNYIYASKKVSGCVLEDRNSPEPYVIVSSLVRSTSEINRASQLPRSVSTQSNRSDVSVDPRCTRSSRLSRQSRLASAVSSIDSMVEEKIILNLEKFKYFGCFAVRIIFFAPKFKLLFDQNFDFVLGCYP